MKYMMLIKTTPEWEASGQLPGREVFEAMAKYNEELVKAGVLLAGDGLAPSKKGAKVKKVDGKRVVIDGPFTETKELIAGFWMIQVKSLEEAIEWAARVPLPDGEEIEVRKVTDASDFPPELFTAEDAAREQQLRDQLPGM